MNKEQLLKAMKDMQALLETALTDPKLAYEDKQKAISDAEKQLDLLKEIVVKSKELLDNTKLTSLTDAQKKEMNDFFGTMATTTDARKKELENYSQKLADAHTHGAADAKGKELEEAAKNAGQTALEGFKGVTGKVEEMVGKITDWTKSQAKSFNWQSLLTSAGFGLIGVFLGKMFGRGFLGTLFSIGLGIAGVIMGQDFAKKQGWGATAKNTPNKDAPLEIPGVDNTHPDLTKNTPPADPAASPTQKAQADVKKEMDPEIQEFLKYYQAANSTSQAPALNTAPTNNNLQMARKDAAVPARV